MKFLLTDAVASFFSSKGEIMNDLVHWAIEFGITFIVAVVMYITRKRDDAQQNQIDEFNKLIHDQVSDLYSKHTNDADRLHNLELDVAKNFFPKEEINKMHDDQRRYLDGRFDRLEKLFDESRK